LGRVFQLLLHNYVFKSNNALTLDAVELKCLEFLAVVFGVKWIVQTFGFDWVFEHFELVGFEIRLSLGFVLKCYSELAFSHDVYEIGGITLLVQIFKSGKTHLLQIL
jgi:hypothetical protein